MTTRPAVGRKKLVVGLAVAALCGAVVTVAVRGTPAPAAPNPPPLGTVAVVRTDLSSTVLTEGTLGYTASPPVVNELSGTYTAVLTPGTIVQPGQVLYRVDNTPVALLAGTVPAWRPFTPGMVDGPDVTELEADVIALGDAQGLLDVASPHYGAAAVAAVDRLQAALGEAPTGSIAFGEVAFVPTALRIESAGVSPGQPAAPGDRPYQVTTTTRAVSVPLTPEDPPVDVGQAVSIVLPSGTSTPGVVSATGPPPSAGAGSSSNASTVLTVTPVDSAPTGTADGESVQVSLSVQSVRHVLAVPVAALLALAEGGYGLEVVGPSGRHHLVGVRTGVF
ncbi:MAG: hypothetical protein JO368_10095, partial [Acidimicrobiales bacterium]|nr:hypothetical protein [Acidimicrobiales bacterium]